MKKILGILLMLPLGLILLAGLVLPFLEGHWVGALIAYGSIGAAIVGALLVEPLY